MKSTLTRSSSMKTSNAAVLAENTNQILRLLITYTLWTLFATGLGLLVYLYPEYPTLNYKGIFRFNGFTLLICTTVAFFGALVRTYSNRYLSGFRQERKFMILTLGFSCAVMLLMISEHVILAGLSWLAMGQFIARLIGVNSSLSEAREAGKRSVGIFLTSSILLGIGIALPAYTLETTRLSVLLANLEQAPPAILISSAVLISVAAMIQSAIYPFHRWLLSSMTAPTPASALMHAGFVNGAGILLTLFAPLIILTDMLTPLFIIGGLTAVIAQFSKLIQVSVKQRLACSTIAQMGFMIMQCGLGFFNAAVAHLILHGFYKAYLFLSAGEGIKPTQPSESPQIRIKPLQALFVLLNGLLGAFLFVRLTGKGMHLDSGIFLTLIVSITVGQVAYNFIKQNYLPVRYRLVLPIVLYLVSIAIYAGIYNVVTVIMTDIPMVAAAQPLTPVQVFFGILFLLGFFLMKLGYYRNHPWLYVRLLNLTQPFKATILRFKNQSL